MAALNFELPQGDAPEWIEVLPAGDVVTGRDGRSWKKPSAEAIVSRTRSLGRDIPVDIEHATELKAPKGEPAPAVGWSSELQVRDGGSIWMRVQWNDTGKQAVASRAYRYISPVFTYHLDTQEIVAITSVGLTNQPNLFITALNRAQQTLEENPVETFLKALCAALGITVDDFNKKENQDKLLAALNQMKGDLQTALNRAEHPSLEKFVPRADYDTALKRATNAEEKLAQIEKSSLDSKIDTAINAALAAGKITPATVDYHKAQCAQEGGLERFEAFVAAAPVIGNPSDLDHRNPGDDKNKALNAEQKRIAEMFGNTEEDLKKYGS